MKGFSRLVAFALLVPALSLAACGDDPVDDDDHAEDVASIRLTIGTQTITMNSAGAFTGGPVNLVRNTATPITAVFLKADGSTVSLSNEFRIELTPSAGITFARTGNFTGTLTGTTTGSGTVAVCLLHIPEDHCEIGSKTAHVFSVNVQ